MASAYSSNQSTDAGVNYRNYMNTPISDSVPDFESRLADVQRMAKIGCTADEILKYLVSDCGLMGKAQLMIIFRYGFDAQLKDVSCIGGWWIDGEGELGDSEINGFLQPILNSYVKSI